MELQIHVSPLTVLVLLLPLISSSALLQVLGVLAGELGGLVEGSLRAAERCAVIEALLYLQVGGWRHCAVGSWLIVPQCRWHEGCATKRSWVS